MADWMSDWMADCMTDWMADYMTDWVTDCMTDLMADTGWLTGWLGCCFIFFLFGVPRWSHSSFGASLLFRNFIVIHGSAPSWAAASKGTHLLTPAA